MQVKNNYDKEAFNGDICVIASVNMEDRTLKVDFDGRMIEYDAAELDELVHAYATTVHNVTVAKRNTLLKERLANQAF